MFATFHKCLGNIILFSIYPCHLYHKLSNNVVFDVIDLLTLILPAAVIYHDQFEIYLITKCL